jgi:hypothetical protein
MADYPINPTGWNNEPVILAHLALEHTHPDDPRLHLAACAPVWFSTTHDVPQGAPILPCPGCMSVLRRSFRGMDSITNKAKKKG